LSFETGEERHNKENFAGKIDKSRKERAHILELDNVSFSYDEKPLLNSITAKINSGEFAAITGANGSGKTTLALLLAGILKPSSGKVLLDGVKSDDTEDFENQRVNVGIVFENPDNQFITTSVERELAFGLENAGVKTEEIKRKVEETLVKFHLKHLRFRSPHTLSGGEKQKVAIASILILKPEHLILDEPTTYLDPKSRAEIFDVILDLKERISVTLITHFPEEKLLVDTIYLLEKGRLEKKSKGEINLISESLDFLRELRNKGMHSYEFPPTPEVLCHAIESAKSK